MNQQLEQQVQDRMEQYLRSRHALIFGLAKLADCRDNDTGQHLYRICEFSELLASQMAKRYEYIDKTWIKTLRLAASMHDIGKVGVPDQVLLKAGQLDKEERHVVEKHTVIGSDTLIAIRNELGDDALINMSVQVTLFHHERWDGSGYPTGLRREEIPLSARIVALADVYDALTSERVYKPAMSHEQAVRIINESSGSHFDPEVVDAFNVVNHQMQQIREDLDKPTSLGFHPRETPASA